MECENTELFARNPPQAPLRARRAKLHFSAGGVTSVVTTTMITIAE
jgi:hypothetical protein